MYENYSHVKRLVFFLQGMAGGTGPIGPAGPPGLPVSAVLSHEHDFSLSASSWLSSPDVMKYHRN